jgi:hypothetical protein
MADKLLQTEQALLYSFSKLHAGVYRIVACALLINTINLLNLQLGGLQKFCKKYFKFDNLQSTNECTRLTEFGGQKHRRIH